MKLERYYLYLLLVLSGCSTGGQILDPEVYYVHDLDVKINGYWHKGMGVASSRSKYNIKIKSPGRMTTLLINTCHRQMKIHDAGKKEKIEFISSKEEIKQGCSFIRFSTFDKKRERHAQAIIWIDQGVHKQKAKMFCNGKIRNHHGVSVCHALKGLYQRIEFDRVVRLKQSKKESCKIDTAEQGKVFRFKIAGRECDYRFTNSDGENHYMYTSGYEQTIIRN